MKQIFDFAEEPAGLWPEILKRLRERGCERLRSRVSWGAHEQVRGMRDFSKSSRLKIEKYLRLVQEQGFTVELEFGFSKRKEAFPSWIWDDSRLGKVPVGIWDEESSPGEMQSTPTLFVEEVRLAYLEFLEEALTLLHLYREPEGPIASIEFDPGPLALEQQVAWSRLSSFLENRFGNISSLNSLFQTSFRDFSAACTPAAQKAMWDKRPWLAAWYLRQAREAAWSEWELPLETAVPVSPEGMQFLFDSTVVDWHPTGGVFPFSPNGLSSEFSRQSFALMDYLQTRGAGLLPLELADSQKAAVVFCGKYLSKASAERLSKNRPILFPLGAPQYDEHMAVLPRQSNWQVRSLPLDNDLWPKTHALAREVCGCA